MDKLGYSHVEEYHIVIQTYALELNDQHKYISKT